ncbi:MAG: PqqD family protein [Nannocystaceae bacterium]
MDTPLSVETRLARTADHVAAELKGETVLLHLQSGRYHALNGVGSFIWSCLSDPQTVEQLCAAIVATYEVEVSRCRQDVLALSAEMLAAGLVVIHPSTPTS